MRRIALFLATNVAVLLVLGTVLQMFGVEQQLYRAGVGINLQGLLAFSGLFGMGGAFISLAISKWLAKTSLGVRVIREPANEAERWLIETVHRLALRAGVGMPEVGLYDGAQPNAFATGMRRDHALVAVSRGLLQEMEREEVEAVLGHELTHVANGDMVTLGLIQGVVNTFVIFLSRVIGFVVDRVILRNERGVGPGYFLATIVAQVFLSVLATMVVMAFSRWREFRADAGGARLAGRHKMVAALRRLQAVYEPQDLPGSLAAFGVQGRIATGLARLFMSHPPLEERIAALERDARQEMPAGVNSHTHG